MRSMRGLNRYPSRNRSYRVGQPSRHYRGKPSCGAHCGVGYLGLLKAILGKKKEVVK